MHSGPLSSQSISWWYRAARMTRIVVMIYYSLSEICMQLSLNTAAHLTSLNRSVYVSGIGPDKSENSNIILSFNEHECAVTGASNFSHMYNRGSVSQDSVTIIHIEYWPFSSDPSSFLTHPEIRDEIKDQLIEDMYLYYTDRPGAGFQKRLEKPPEFGRSCL